LQESATDSAIPRKAFFMASAPLEVEEKRVAKSVSSV
jgi:hypothetical protein